MQDIFVPALSRQRQIDVGVKWGRRGWQGERRLDVSVLENPACSLFRVHQSKPPVRGLCNGHVLGCKLKKNRV